MFGGEIPSLDDTPCAACGEAIAPSEAVWDPYHRGERRFAALPYHRACAAEVLPPPTPSEEQRRCSLCGERFEDPQLSAAFAQLHDRFRQAQGSLRTPEIVWRLASREPARVFAAEHFACVLERVTGKRDEPPGLPPQRGED